MAIELRGQRPERCQPRSILGQVTVGEMWTSGEREAASFFSNYSVSGSAVPRNLEMQAGQETTVWT